MSDVVIPSNAWIRLPDCEWEVWHDTGGAVTLGQLPVTVKLRRAGGAEPIPMRHHDTRKDT